MTGAPATPAVTVAMSVYNAAPYLALAIESILAQTFGEFEFLIVNDGSNDGSAEIIDSYAARDPRVRPIHQDNRGLVASLNRMIDEARAPLIARMDGDDISMPERFEKQLAFLDSNPDFGVVGTLTINIDEAGKESWLNADQPTDWEGFRDALKDKPLLCHPSAMIRTEMIRAAGGYRAAFKHCEDYDLWLRLSERTKLCSLPDRLLLYRYSDSQVSEKHIYAQALGAAVAWLAHVEREAGRPDPIDGLDSLPPLESLDSLFGRPGVARAVRKIVAPRLIYSPVALKGDGYDLVLTHARDGAREGMWKTAARLVRFGEPLRAMRLAAALATP
ncbi:MAG: glycosyltransferase family 2 protein [Allosphingosinicella sp.]|uniref:glycosyltransferase family 2 protein n=1 Tax=Allosphingosinicella sp. TaxID=2823234 RepID=UPI0039300863